MTDDAFAVPAPAWQRFTLDSPAADALPDDIVFGAGIPGEAELRLCGDSRASGCSTSAAARATTRSRCARQGATSSRSTRRPSRSAWPAARGDAAEVRVEWHECDARRPRVPARRLASTSRSLPGLAGEVDDLDRLAPPGPPRAPAGRRVRLLVRPSDGARDRSRRSSAPSALPLGTLEVRRSYFDRRAVHDVTRDDERIHVMAAHARRRGPPRRRPRRADVLALRAADHDHRARRKQGL